MSAPPAFTPDQRAELEGIGVSSAQVEALAEALPMLRHFSQPRPEAQDVRNAVEGLARAKADVADLEALLAGHLPAKVEAAGMLAFYLDRDPALGRAEFEAPWHPQAHAVLRRELAAAQRRVWAVEMVLTEVKGRRQQEVSATAVAFIHAALQGAQAPGQREFAVSYGETSSFSRIVSICMSAAAGGEDRDYKRWIKAYMDAERGGAGGDDDGVAPHLNGRPLGGGGV